MAYRAAKRMTLGGVKFQPGEPIGEEVLASMPMGRLDSLRRVGHVVETFDAPEPAPAPSPAPSRKGRKKALEIDLEEEATEVESSEEPEEAPAEDETDVSSEPEAST